MNKELEDLKDELDQCLRDMSALDNKMWEIQNKIGKLQEYKGLSLEKILEGSPKV